MRQASMYHYVGGKEELLAELLEARSPRRSPSPGPCSPTTRALPSGGCGNCAASDVELLCAGPHNLGALYLLPEVAPERFAAFRDARAALKSAYASLLAATAAGAALAPADLALRADLLFALIEGLILANRSTPVFAAAAADAALRVAGVPEGYRVPRALS